MENHAKEYKYFPSRYYSNTGRNYMEPIFDYIISRYNFRRVIDIGSGDGLFGSYLKEKTGCFITGVDANRLGLDKAGERGYDDTFFIDDLSGKRLPFMDSSYDLVLCKDVLEHLFDPMQTLRECARILKKDGRMLVHVPNHFPIYYRLKFLFTGRIDTQDYYPGAKEWEFPHIRFYTSFGLNSMLKETGFVVEKDLSDNFAFFGPLFSRMPLASRISRFMSRKSPDNFSIGFTLFCKKA